MIVKGSSYFQNFKEVDIKLIRANVTVYDEEPYGDSGGYSIMFDIFAKSEKMKKYKLCTFIFSGGGLSLGSLKGGWITFFHIDSPEEFKKAPLEIKNHYEWIKIGKPFKSDDAMPFVKKALEAWLAIKEDKQDEESVA